MGNCGLVGAFSSDTTLSTPVPINKGGTGQTTAQAALDALAAASGSLVQGDIFIVDSSGNVVALARGSDNQTLLMNGSNPNWETVSAGGATAEIDNATITSDFSTTSSSFTDVTSLVITIGDITDGKTMITAILTIKRSTDGSMSVILEDDSSELATTHIDVESTHTKEYNMCTSYAMESDASVVQVQVKTGGGTLVVKGASSAATSQIVSMSVG